MVDFEGKCVKLLLIVSPDESTSLRVQPAWEEAETLAAHSGGREYSAHTGRTVEGGAEGIRAWGHIRQQHQLSTKGNITNTSCTCNSVQEFLYTDTGVTCVGDSPQLFIFNCL